MKSGQSTRAVVVCGFGFGGDNLYNTLPLIGSSANSKEYLYNILGRNIYYLLDNRAQIVSFQNVKHVPMGDMSCVCVCVG